MDTRRSEEQDSDSAASRPLVCLREGFHVAAHLLDAINREGPSYLTRPLDIETILKCGRGDDVSVRLADRGVELFQSWLYTGVVSDAYPVGVLLDTLQVINPSFSDTLKPFAGAIDNCLDSKGRDALVAAGEAQHGSRRIAQIMRLVDTSIAACEYAPKFARIVCEVVVQDATLEEATDSCWNFGETATEKEARAQNASKLWTWMSTVPFQIPTPSPSSSSPPLKPLKNEITHDVVRKLFQGRVPGMTMQLKTDFLVRCDNPDLVMRVMGLPDLTGHFFNVIKLWNRFCKRWSTEEREDVLADVLRLEHISRRSQPSTPRRHFMQLQGQMLLRTLKAILWATHINEETGNVVVSNQSPETGFERFRSDVGILLSALDEVDILASDEALFISIYIGAMTDAGIVALQSTKIWGVSSTCWIAQHDPELLPRVLGVHRRRDPDASACDVTCGDSGDGLLHMLARKSDTYSDIVATLIRDLDFGRADLLRLNKDGETAGFIARSLDQNSEMTKLLSVGEQVGKGRQAEPGEPHKRKRQERSIDSVRRFRP